MKRRMVTWAMILIVALGAVGCTCGGIRLPFRVVTGSGKVVEEQREVSDFTGIDLASLGSMAIELGDREELRIEAEDNLLRYIETEVRDGVLEIRHQQRVNLVPTEPIRFYLTVRELDSIVVSGAGDVKVPSLQTERFSVRLTGAGSVRMDELNADTLEAGLNGAGGLFIDGGEVAEQDVEIDGAGGYAARDLDSAEARVRLSGLGSATLRVRDRLDVRITGAGSVRYIGNPEVEQEITGLGKVERINE